MEEFKEYVKNNPRKIKLPTLFNADKTQLSEYFNFTEEQAKRNTGTTEQIDTKIQCPKCKGKMHRAYKDSIFTIFGASKTYVGWLCQNEKCHHYIKRADIYKEWGYEYKERIDLEI